MEPKPIRPKLAHTLLAWLAVAVVLAFCGYVYFHSPFEGRVTMCTFHAVTGLDCPGCGMTRAGYLLLHGHPIAALKQNPFILVIVCAGYIVIAELSPYLFHRQFKKFFPPNWLLITLGVLVVVYTIARNLHVFL